MKKLSYIFCLILVIFTSCSETKYEYKQRTISAKTTDLSDGTTNYRIAFENGDSDTYSFGTYTKYKVGDTICEKREQGWFWYIIECN